MSKIKISSEPQPICTSQLEQCPEKVEIYHAIMGLDKKNQENIVLLISMNIGLNRIVQILNEHSSEKVTIEKDTTTWIDITDKINILGEESLKGILRMVQSMLNDGITMNKIAKHVPLLTESELNWLIQNPKYKE